VNSRTGTLDPSRDRSRTAFPVLGAISVSHMINDMMQSLILAIYPILKGDFSLSFAQIGLITLTYQLTASLFQPLIGTYTDRRPTPYSLPIGCWRSRAAMRQCSPLPRWWVWARRSSIPSRRGSRASRRVGAMGSRNRCSRSAGTRGALSVHWWPQPSSCRSARRALRGSAQWR
jgi:hypothetical protein